MHKTRKLSGLQQQKIQEALLSAFRQYNDLRQLVRFQLDENLENITSNAGQSLRGLFNKRAIARKILDVNELSSQRCSLVS